MATTIWIGAILLILAMANATMEKLIPSVSWPQNFIPVPMIRQATDYTCGVAATASVINFWTGDEWLESELAKKLHANEQDGTRYRNIKSFAEKQGYSVTLYYNMTLSDLFTVLDKGTPLIILIQAWPDSYPVDWANDWDDGHFVVAMGYDDTNVYFMDPSTTGHYTYIERNEFLERWHDIDGPSEKVVHFGILLTLDTPPTYNFTAITALE